MDGIIKQVAKRNGVTPEQVRKDISEMIRDAMSRRNDTPEARALWDELSPDGKEPSVEKFIAFVAVKANSLKKKNSI